MKTFLIIIGCIFLYIFGGFIAFVLSLYCDRCEYGPSMVYDDMDEDNLWFSLLWPITIWFALGYLLYLKLKKYALGYLLYLKLKKYAIAITEILYQMNHNKEGDEK